MAVRLLTARSARCALRRLLLVILGDDPARLPAPRALRAVSSPIATNAHGVARYLAGAASSIAISVTIAAPSSSARILFPDEKSPACPTSWTASVTSSARALTSFVRSSTSTAAWTQRCKPSATPSPCLQAQRRRARRPRRRSLARRPRRPLSGARVRLAANREAVLQAASQRPGATSAELAAVSGVEPNTLSGLIRRLVKAGELQQRALPTGRTGYAIADTPPAHSSDAGSADTEDSVASGDDAEPSAPPDMP